MGTRMKVTARRRASAILALLALAPAAALGAQSKVFTIANYPVEATAKDAVAAKEKAHAEGQQAALGALFKRLVPVTSYNRIDRLKSIRAADLVDGVAIRSESNSSTRYIASLDFSFQADAVRSLLSREGVPFIEEQAPRMVLVPVMAETKDGATRYTAASGDWAGVWKGLDLENTLTPLKIAPLLPAVPQDAISAALDGDDRFERAVTSAYESDFVLFAVADVDPAEKMLNVVLAGIDPAGLVSWRRGYRIGDGDIGYAMELAAVVSQGVLEGRWKVAKSEDAMGGGGSPGAGGNEVHLAVEFVSPGEWDDLRGRILDTPGIDDVRIEAVSAQSANVSVRYPGGGLGLATVLSRQGLVLTDAGGTWILRSGY